MSEPEATPSDAVQPIDRCVKYWTPGRLLAGVLMVVVAVGVVVFVRWDTIKDIAASFGEQRFELASLDRPEFFTEVFDLTDLRVSHDRLIPGGPAKDGIPALTDPRVVPVAEAGFMRPDDRVVGVTLNGESRAYPIKVLNWHECYNDTLGGVPIAVVFCPLCDSVTVVDRRLDGKTYEFGISGLLYNSNVLLYDRQDDGLWSQAGLIAVSGPNAGRSLTHLHNWSITTFEDWRDAKPGSTVASVETGHYSLEHYNRVAYASYFQTDEVMFPVEPRDERFPNKHPVVGVRFGETTRAYPLDVIAEAPGGRIHDTIGGRALILEAHGEPRSLRIIESPEGAELIHTFWFAWYAFHPQTQVYTGGATGP